MQQGGARFDADTLLPFAEAEALAKGMVKVDPVETPPEMPAQRDTVSRGQVLASR